MRPCAGNAGRSVLTGVGSPLAQAQRGVVWVVHGMMGEPRWVSSLRLFGGRHGTLPEWRASCAAQRTRGVPCAAAGVSRTLVRRPPLAAETRHHAVPCRRHHLQRAWAREEPRQGAASACLAAWATHPGPAGLWLGLLAENCTPAAVQGRHAPEPAPNNTPCPALPCPESGGGREQRGWLRGHPVPGCASHGSRISPEPEAAAVLACAHARGAARRFTTRGPPLTARHPNTHPTLH
jgi:hypothetical protein